MPIVFQEVTGEIAPERERTSAEPVEPAPRADHDPADVLRRVIALMREREARLRTD